MVNDNKKLNVHETKFSTIAGAIGANTGGDADRFTQALETIYSVSNTTQITKETEEYVQVKADNERLKAEAATFESDAAGLKQQLKVQKGGLLEFIVDVQQGYEGQTWQTEKAKRQLSAEEKDHCATQKKKEKTYHRKRKHFVVGIGSPRGFDGQRIAL
mmetsp:Transcript_1443/g.1602  ORF Transcript_1443/g.1602 Transcript_1443/m.1602 type:complete len:159 (-) Transcript_1443:304-780(-)